MGFLLVNTILFSFVEGKEDIRVSPFEGVAPIAGGYIDLSYSVGLDPSGGSVTPPPPLASNSRLSRAISDSYLLSVPPLEVILVMTYS
jgi:hypothetical protein